MASSGKSNESDKAQTNMSMLFYFQRNDRIQAKVHDGRKKDRRGEIAGSKGSKWREKESSEIQNSEVRNSKRLRKR